MVRSALCVLALFAACVKPPAPTTPAPIATCPACPEPAPKVCPELQCPAQDCSTCVKPTPEPMAHDWHCLEVRRPDGFTSTYCFTLARVCEYMRKRAIDKRIGKPTACTTQHTAFCLETSNAQAMSRQTLCAGSAESCATQRQKLLEKKPRPVDHATECQPMLNTDTFETGRPAAMQQ